MLDTLQPIVIIYFESKSYWLSIWHRSSEFNIGAQGLTLKRPGVFRIISHVSICLLKSKNRNNEQALYILELFFTRAKRFLILSTLYYQIYTKVYKFGHLSVYIGALASSTSSLIILFYLSLVFYMTL